MKKLITNKFFRLIILYILAIAVFTFYHVRYIPVFYVEMEMVNNNIIFESNTFYTHRYMESFVEKMHKIRGAYVGEKEQRLFQCSIKHRWVFRWSWEMNK